MWFSNAMKWLENGVKCKKKSCEDREPKVGYRNGKKKKIRDSAQNSFHEYSHTKEVPTIIQSTLVNPTTVIVRRHHCAERRRLIRQFDIRHKILVKTNSV